jgi:hypothetical protein
MGSAWAVRGRMAAAARRVGRRVVRMRSSFV